MMISWVASFKIALAAGLLVLGIGCGSSDYQCSETTPCEGLGETCVEGECVSKSCASSISCSMEQYCDRGACVSGCAADTDCYPGDFCETESASCQPTGCRSTSLDCSFGQFCDMATGDCYDASGYYCMPCEDSWGESDCGGNGNICLPWGAVGSFCGVTCEYETDCPAGYTCVGISDGNSNIITHQCIALCWIYEEDRRSAAAATAPGGGPLAGIDGGVIVKPDPTEPPGLETCPVETSR